MPLSYLPTEGVGVGVGVFVGVSDTGVKVTWKPKSSHVKSVGVGVFVGVFVGVIEGVTVIDGVFDGVGLLVVVTDGVGLIEGVGVVVTDGGGVGVGVTVHSTSPQVVVAELTKCPLIISVALPLTNVKQFSGRPSEGIVTPDISILMVVFKLPVKK